ncbi:unnamed protein product [Symbiodinium sp. CCMP2592]|nr:unnamed protein product [Symbiodinium sp. CCMP2592]
MGSPRRPSGIAANLQGQACGGMITEEGCGFVAVALPRLRWTLMVVCVYLQSAVGLHGGCNPEVLAALRPALRDFRTGMHLPPIFRALPGPRRWEELSWRLRVLPSTRAKPWTMPWWRGRWLL